MKDFRSDDDNSDVWGLDASASAAGDQTFAWFVTAAFTGVAGQLRCELVGSSALVLGDVNGDGIADLCIGLTNVWELAARDFAL